MDPFQTPGAVSWHELTTPDPAAAQAFYGALFGWRFETMNMGPGPYHVVKVGADDAIGGIMATPPEAKGAPPMWGSYVTVSDCDAAAAVHRARRQGLPRPDGHPHRRPLCHASGSAGRDDQHHRRRAARGLKARPSGGRARAGAARIIRAP